MNAEGSKQCCVKKIRPRSNKLENIAIKNLPMNNMESPAEEQNLVAARSKWNAGKQKCS